MPTAVAIDVMHKLGRSPKPMGELLFRVTGKEGDKSRRSGESSADRRSLERMRRGPATGGRC